MTDQVNTGQPTKVRIDAWLWAVRLCKTRSEAATACRAGHVKLNTQSVRPSATVVPGDTITLWLHHQEKRVEVARLISKRVSATIASTCYIDHSPERPPREIFASLPVRDRGAGRPTKHERRQIDKLRGRNTNR